MKETERKTVNQVEIRRYGKCEIEGGGRNGQNKVDESKPNLIRDLG